MPLTRPWTARVPAALVVASAWTLSTLYLLLAPTPRVVGWPWGVATHPHPLATDARAQAALGVAVLLLCVGCHQLARRPAAAMCALVLSALVLNLDVHSSDITPDQYLPVCVALYCVVASGSRRTAVTGAAPAFAGLVAYVVVCLARGLAVDTAVEAVVLLVLVLAWVLGNAQRRERLHADELRSRTADQAVTAERLRIARELHDMVAHDIGVVALQAGAAKLVLPARPEGAQQALEVIEETSRDILAGLRRMLGVLHDAEAVRSEAPLAGLDDLDRLVANARSAGVRVDVAWRGERRPLPQEIDLSLFRIVQESVTNVMKHSGTRQCQVSLTFRQHEVSLAVVDDGSGGGGRRGGTGYGISGMRERVELLHGDFSAGPRPGGGFTVTARVPVPDPAVRRSA